MTLLFVMNLGFAWGTGAAPPGQRPRASRYRVGYRVTDITRPGILALIAWGLL